MAILEIKERFDYKRSHLTHRDREREREEKKKEILFLSHNLAPFLSSFSLCDDHAVEFFGSRKENPFQN